MGKHEKTLAAILAEPARSNIKWRDVEALFAHYGAVIEEGAGSRVRVILGARSATFHRPHPRPDTKKATVRDIREFLRETGVIS